MLKHTSITRRRIDSFVQHQLKQLIYGEEHPLKIEINESSCATQNEAKKGTWQEVESGYKYGPAYTVFWFRVSGKVPQSMAGLETVIRAEVGGERTVWRDNSPYCGIDVEHSDFGWLEGRNVALSPASTAGAKVEEYIQVYTRNPQTTVHGKEKPRTPMAEEVKEAKLVVFRRPIQELVYDFDFAKSLLDTIDEKDPAYTIILRGLNDAINAFNFEVPESIQKSRKAIKDCLGQLNGEFKHAVTPVGHAHLDTAWLWPLSITHLKMAHTAANQLRLMEKHPEYVFVHSQASQYEWLENEYPKLFEEVKSAIKKGQWEVVGSMWVEADCNLTGGESLIRQFLYGMEYFRKKLGVETKDMWLPDVFGYSAALPQILTKFGIKYFLTQKISWNQFNKFPHHTFWWQGIDGTKVWSHFLPSDTYCGSAEPKEIVFSVRNYKDHSRADQSLYAFGFGDGGGGPTERHLALLKRGRLAPSYPEINFGKHALDFFKESYEKSKDLMTWVGELYLELHRGTYTSQAANKRGNRFSEFLLRDAEWLASFSTAKYPSDELERLWKLVLLNQFHDIIPGSSVNEVYRDSDRDYAEILEKGNALIEKSLAQIGAKLDTNQCEKPMALFHNTTLTTQSQVSAHHFKEGQFPESVVCGDDTFPVQVVDLWGDKQVIFETPAAAMGSVAIADFRRQSVSTRARLKANSRKLENDEWSVRFDSNGNIVSIQSLDDGSEFIAPGELANMFQILDDHPLFWSAWDVDVYSGETAKPLIKSESFEVVERGPVRVAVEVVKTFGKSTIKQRISLGPTPGIRFDTWVDWHEEDKMLKVAFPLNINSARAAFEIQFGHVERPTHDNTTWDMAKFEVCAQKWADLSEADHGVALINTGKYGYDVKNGVMRLSLLRSPKAPDPECDMGEHRFTYVLYPHFGGLNLGEVVQTSYAINAETRSAHLAPSKGESGKLPPFVFCEDRNLVVETVKRAEDGTGMIVRLYESHNAKGKAPLSIIKSFRSAWLCSLDEKPIEELEAVEDQVMIEYKPFEIITVKFETD